MKLRGSTTQQDELRENLLLTFDLFETGLSLRRERLRRDHPEFSDEQVEDALRRWLGNRPPDGPI